MKYDQYLHWRSRVSSLIAAKVNEIKPRPSDYVTVLDQAIGVAPAPTPTPPPPEPTWLYLLKGAIRSSDGGEVPEMTAATFTRSGLIFQNGYFRENTQVIDSGPPDSFIRTRTLFFRMTSDDQYNPVTGLGIYQGGLLLTLGMYSILDAPDPYTAPIVRQYRVAVRRTQTSQLLTPPGPGVFETRILSAERL
jgi:hypothetical protein